MNNRFFLIGIIFFYWRDLYRLGIYILNCFFWWCCSLYWNWSFLNNLQIAIIMCAQINWNFDWLTFRCFFSLFLYWLINWFCNFFKSRKFLLRSFGLTYRSWSLLIFSSSLHWIILLSAFQQIFCHFSFLCWSFLGYFLDIGICWQRLWWRDSYIIKWILEIYATCRLWRCKCTL